MGDAAMRTEALNTPQVTSWSIGIIAGVLVVAAVFAIVVRNMIKRLLVLVVAVVLVGFVWKQQHAIENNICNLHRTFFGVHVQNSGDEARSCSSS